MSSHQEEPVEIVSSDPHWLAKYAAERDRILAATKDLFVGFEHIGSTAVPGLAAKPIIDMMGGLRSLDDAPRCVEVIVGLGYEYVPEFEDVFPERRYFRTCSSEGRRTHQLHVVTFGGDWWLRHIQFRDVLRADGEIRKTYEQLKLNLAAQHANDRMAYTDGKDEFIAAVLARAP